MCVKSRRKTHSFTPRGIYQLSWYASVSVRGGGTLKHVKSVSSSNKALVSRSSTRRYLDRPDGGSKAIKHALTCKHLTQAPAANRTSENCKHITCAGWSWGALVSSPHDVHIVYGHGPDTLHTRHRPKLASSVIPDHFLKSPFYWTFGDYNHTMLYNGRISHEN